MAFADRITAQNHDVRRILRFDDRGLTRGENQHLSGLEAAAIYLGIPAGDECSAILVTDWQLDSIVAGYCHMRAEHGGMCSDAGPRTECRAGNQANSGACITQLGQVPACVVREGRLRLLAFNG